MKIYPEKVWIDVDSKDKPFILHNEATMGMCAYIRSDLNNGVREREEVYEDAIGKLKIPLNIIIATMKDQKNPVAAIIKSWAEQGIKEADETLDRLALLAGDER